MTVCSLLAGGLDSPVNVDLPAGAGREHSRLVGAARVAHVLRHERLGSLQRLLIKLPPMGGGWVRFTREREMSLLRCRTT